MVYKQHKAGEKLLPTPFQVGGNRKLTKKGSTILTTKQQNPNKPGPKFSAVYNPE